MTRMLNIKRIAIIISLLLIIVLGSTFAYKFFIRPNRQAPEPTWYTTEKSYDIVTGSGKLISLSNTSRGGITILPPDYEEKTRDFTISIYDPKSNTESAQTIFSQIPELTSIKLLQNTINPDKIWVISFDQVSGCQKFICNFKISEFDVNIGETTPKSTIQFNLNGSKEVSLHSFIPLLHDPVLNQIWFAYNLVDPKYQNNFFDILKNRNVTEEKSAYTTSIIAYDANANTTTFNRSLMRGVNFNNRQHNYDVDQNGDLYIDTECIFRECPSGTDNVINSANQIYRISPSNSTYNPILEPIFTYGMKDSLREFTIDQDNSAMYLVNMTWNAGPGSTVLHYDTNRKISSQIGVPPIAYEDDVRGILSTQNKLLIGTFHGLGIFDKQTDTWRMVTSNEGIRDDNVELVTVFVNGICLRHESHGSSCHYGPLDQL